MVTLEGGEEVQLDVVVAADDADEPGKRTILAIGEANAGSRLGSRVIDRLTAARSALGPRAANAKLLAFGASLGKGVRRRADVVAVDLERLYG